MDQKILEKIQKLLTLAKNSGATEGEAANAAGRAQILMTKHNIKETMINLDGEEKEVITNWKDPLDISKRMPIWKSMLTMAIAEPNNCMVYQNGDSFFIIGEELDAETVRYLYKFIRDQIILLSLQLGGYSRGWKNSWRAGLVDTIRVRLREAKEEALKQVYEEAQTGGTALVVVDNALAKIESRKIEVDAIGKRLGLRSKKSYQNSNMDARSQGRADGHGIKIGGSGRRISAGQRQLGGK